MEQKITLKEAVSKRKSVRSYDMTKLSDAELSQIREFADKIPVLIPNVKTKMEIIGPDDVKSIMGWRAPHYLALYGEDSDAGRMSVGYIYEQVVLYMTALDLGTCWATSVSPKDKHENDGTVWTAVVAFGKVKDGEVWRNGEAKRKDAKEVYEGKSEALEAARLAPSAMNNQPWYFENDGDSVSVYCKKQGFLKKWMVSQNRIDIGIALGNICAVSPFQFTMSENNIEKDGYTLMGKIRFE